MNLSAVVHTGKMLGKHLLHLPLRAFGVKTEEGQSRLPIYQRRVIGAASEDTKRSFEVKDSFFGVAGLVSAKPPFVIQSYT